MKTIFSPCRKYRYTLWRQWDMQHDLEASQGGGAYDRTGQFVQFIGLNPSTADEVNNDPTVRRCIDYAQRWGFGGLCMTNIFAWRDTDPEAMKRAKEPIGPENDYWLTRCAMEAGMVVAAWGKHGSHLGRGEAVKAMLPGVLHRLAVNLDGSPKHPLYLSKELTPIPL